MIPSYKILQREDKILLIQALREKKIRSARKNFKDFVLFTKQNFELNWHHDLMFDLLQEFIDGKIQNLCIEAPPRHTKSETVSRRLPAFLLGLDPVYKIILGSYADSLASAMNRDVQRILDEERYISVFPDTRLNGKNIRPDAKGNWLRNADQFEIVGHGGGMKTVGRGAGVTGFGADFLLVDDPLKNREEAKSKTIRDKTWDWFTNDLMTRSEGRKQILVTQCMTGDTIVLLADGSGKQLKDICQGDDVATYENGKISRSTIVNWKNCGPDNVFAIRTTSGITVKANERHPFLVCRDGENQWVRVRDLKLTDKMIRVSATLSSNTETRLRYLKAPLSIYGATLDPIIEIIPIGTEEVFDIQVGRTENFIANGVVSHNTRWHEDDLTGRIREHQKSEDFPRFEFLTLQAIKTNRVNHPKDPRQIGEALWPQRYPLKFMAERRASLLNDFESLFQQDPTAEEGGKVKLDWLRFYDKPIDLKQVDRMIVSCDLTFDDRAGSDYTCMSVYAKQGANIYLIHQVHGLMDINDQLRNIPLIMAQFPKIIGVYVERAANGFAVIKLLQNKISGIVPVIPTKSKVDRLDAVLPLYAAGNIHYPSPAIAPWIMDHVKEVLTFPNGKNDDRLDAESQALSVLANDSIEKMKALARL